MKKFSFLALAAAGMLFAACSSDKDVAESNKLNPYDMIEGQSAWIAVGIALPGDEVTRANEDLNDGIAAEYAVKSGRLVLFKGANEADAVLLKDYEITPTFQNEGGDNVPGGNSEGTSPSGFGEVTSTSQKVVQEIESPSLGTEDNLYAYVILNDKNNATGIEYTPGTKFSVFKEQVLKAIGIAAEAKGYGAINTDNGLVMTSVPIANKPGGDAAPAADTEVTTLAKVDRTAIYPTKAAATEGTSVACIYVERAAVKVEVINAVAKITTDGGDLDCTFNGWGLGNTNNNASGYYNTRNFDTEWLPYNNAACATSYLKWRMVGRTNFFSADHTTAYRTYFGKDVNYDGNTGLVNAQMADADYALGTGAVTYTYENTFDENSQKYQNTTYVGFKVTVAGGDFYTIEGKPNTRLVEADLPGEVAANSAVTINAAKATIDAAIKADLEAGTGRTISAGVSSVSYNIVPVVTLGTRDDATGAVSYTWTMKLENLKDGTTDLSPADVAAVNALADVASTLSASHTGTTKLYKYVGGVTYYAARIAHFGDVETPWSAPNDAYNDYDKIYPLDGQSIHDTPVNYGTNRANAWLGRWGIVRNNWYRITVSSIQGLGSPVPEDFSSNVTPDDNPSPSYFIAAHIHILPWAVRKQSVDLK